MTEPRRRDAATTRAAILASAVAEFTEHGYAGAGVRQIAERAGVTAMLINRYFGSKEQLFAEAVDTSFGPPTIVGRGDTGDLAGDLGRTLAARTAPGATPLDPFLLMLRSASDPKAAAIIRDGIERHAGERFAGLLDGPDNHARAQVGLSLVAGVLLMRTVIATTALAQFDDERLAALLGQMFAPVVNP